MNPNHIQNEIRLLLSSIRLFASKLPEVKKVRAIRKIKMVAQKMSGDTNGQELEQVFKDLQYQANFLKLTNPNIQFTKQNIVDKVEEEQFIKEIQEENVMETQDNPIKGNGTYILKDGRIVEGLVNKKQEADHSNWHAGNVDPEDLRRHKEMLDRMNFRGPFWEGKPMPKSVLDEDNPFQKIYEDEPPQKEMKPNLVKPKEESWEQVKR